MGNGTPELSAPATTGRDLERIRSIADTCQRLVDQASVGIITKAQFLERIRDAGVSAEEAQDYAEQLSQRIQQLNVARQPGGGSQAQDRGNSVEGPLGLVRPSTPEREKTPDGLEGEALNEYRSQRDAIMSAGGELDDPGDEQGGVERRRAAFEAAAWAVLKAKLDHLQDPPTVGEAQPSGDLPEDVLDFFGIARPSPGSIPPLILAAAPHLGRLVAQVKTDPHLDETRKLRNAFNKSENGRDALVNELQQFALPEPLPRSIWKKIVQDDFVDFEKLYATMDRGYDHKDDLQTLTEGFAIIKKDQATAKRPLYTEAEWIRVYSAWEAGVGVLFPHRVTELQSYRQVVMELFRAAPGRPQLAIQFDAEVRDRYAKKAFHMDDRSQHNIPLLAQMFRSAASSPSKGIKRTSGAPNNAAKRSDVPCRNWSFGRCEEPCSNRRKHGVCCVCGEQHRAKDNEQCFATLRGRA